MKRILLIIGIVCLCIMAFWMLVIYFPVPEAPVKRAIPGIDVWDFSASTDPMGRGVDRMATIESAPTLIEAFQPAQRALLLASNDAGGGPYITVHIDGAHFSCGDGLDHSCQVLVRFDGAPAFETPAYAANDRGSLGLTDGESLMRALGRSKIFRVELPLQSPTIITFNVAGFPADKMLGESHAAAD